MSIFNWWNNNTNNLLNNLNNNLNFLFPSIYYTNISKSFIETYYNSLHSNHQNIVNLYLHNSKLTYNNEEYLGIELIKQKYNFLDLKEPKFTINNFNAQPIDNNKIIITVIGTIENKLNSSILSFNISNKNNYHETFILVNINNSWFIQNHIFNII